MLKNTNFWQIKNVKSELNQLFYLPGAFCPQARLKQNHQVFLPWSNVQLENVSNAFNLYFQELYLG